MSTMRTDRYMQALGAIARKVESLYGYDRSNHIMGKDILTIISEVNAMLEKMQPEDIKKFNSAVGKELVPLSYISQRLKFFGKKRLDYSKYPGMKSVARVLLTFTKQKTVNMSSIKDVNKIIELLHTIDASYINFQGALGYMYLRNFVLLILSGNYSNASVVADFILNQFITREN